MNKIMRTMNVLNISLAALLFLFSGFAVAQQKYTYKHSTTPQSSRYVQQHRIDVGDVPGHQIRITRFTTSTRVAIPSSEGPRS